MMRLLPDLGGFFESGFHVTCRATVVLLLAALVTRALRRSSAALRHLIWSAAIVGILVMPCLVGIAPLRFHLPEALAPATVERSAMSISDETASLPITAVDARESALRSNAPVKNAPDDAHPRAITSESAPTHPDIRMNWGAVTVMTWFVGALVGLFPLLLGTISLRRLRRNSQPLSGVAADELAQLAKSLVGNRFVAGLLSPERRMPMTWGTLQPVIVFPADFNDWSPERRRLVMLHELAHVRRCDCLFQILAQVMRAWHWFNPLAWWALRQLRLEQEQACDDFVLNHGANAADYATDLLSITASLDDYPWDSAVALAMNRTTRLERRLQSILDQTRNRRPLTKAIVVLSTIVVVGVFLGVAGTRRAVVQAAPLDPPSALAPAQNEATSGPPLKFTTTTPQSKTVTITQPYVGHINSQRHINVRALEKGYLEAISVKEGQFVKKGDLLFKVIPGLHQKKVDVELAELKRARIEYDYNQKLHNDKVVSQNEVDVHKLKLDKAQAQVDLVTARLDFASVKAPFDGLIDRLLFQEGSLVLEGEVLTTMSDNSGVRVYFNVPEARYLDYMQDPHKEVWKIELRLANGTRFPHAGELGAIEADFNNASGNIPFRADFPNPKRLLRHGQAGTILMSRELKDALIIPARATFEVLGKRYVYVIDENNIAHQREITIRSETEDGFVIDKGLATHDRILLEGIRNVHDGEKVSL
ncbi:MAG TPA: efflux RND transporter periplasmic adaptor subunit [Pirellulales bacterium]|jgi:membrane fusion protein (multidrug efflux system)